MQSVSSLRSELDVAVIPHRILLGGISSSQKPLIVPTSLIPESKSATTDQMHKPDEVSEACQPCC